MSFFACDYDHDYDGYWQIDKEEFVVSDGTFIDCELGKVIPQGWQCFKITIDNYEDIDEDLVEEYSEEEDEYNWKEEVEISGKTYDVVESPITSSPAIIESSETFYQFPEVWSFCRRLRFQFQACQNFGDVDDIMARDFFEEMDGTECPLYKTKFDDPKQHPLYLEWQWIKKHYKDLRDSKDVKNV